MSNRLEGIELLDFVLRVSRQMAESHSLAPLLSYTIDQVLTLVGAERGFIALKHEDGSLDFKVRRDNEGNDLPGATDEISYSVLEQVVQTGKAVVLSDAMHDPQFGMARSVMALRLRSIMCVPLITRNRIIGAVYVENRSIRGRFRETDLAPLQLFANQAAIAIENTTLVDDLQRSNSELAQAYDATIEGWSRALDLRDHETEGHTRRVTELSLALARWVGGFTAAELVHLRRGALLHDIGKMGIPDNILLKEGPLDDAEWVVMRRHPQLAQDMLSTIAYLRPALDIPLAHHEWWNGAGYPHGLAGEAIPRAARLFAIVDVWDALCADRPYRRAWPIDKVRAYLAERSGTQFDPALLAAFLEMQAAGPAGERRWGEL